MARSFPVSVVVAFVLLPSSVFAVDRTLEFPGLGDPGELQKISITRAEGDDAAKYGVLEGPEVRWQIVVTGHYASGQLRDLTRDVSYAASPAEIISVDQSGLVRPQADGEATVTVTGPKDTSATVKLTTRNIGNPLTVSFPNQIMPIFTKLGCNSGGCHGKSGGQNGFSLSLLGFYPDEDYEFLVYEARGRRLFPAAPQHSLLLQKASGTVPHGGGARAPEDSFEYRLLRRWVEQGMPRGSADDRRVARIEVLPTARLMDRGAGQQLVVFAHYTDGAIENVTAVAKYESNNTEMAEVTEGGLVKTLDLTGDAAIMVRYQGQVAVFRATIPLGVDIAKLPPARNLVDKHVFEKLGLLGLPPSEGCDDETFIRRVTIDICGRLPTLEELQAFGESQDSAKRDTLIDSLLESTDYAEYFANKWAAVLRNKRVNGNYTRGSFLFHDWIRDCLNRNVPYDDFVRDILAATGDVTQHPPVTWYRSVKTAEDRVEDAAQLFLGLRIKCARCHHHPFERWSQKDYYGFAAFFAQVGTKKSVDGAADELRVYHKWGTATAQNPRSKQKLGPTGLGSEPASLAPDEDPRRALASWLSAPDNPFFASALVNRYWKHFFSRALVEPEDDIRDTNPASNPELLEAVARSFIDSGFDLKALVRTICRSTTYQLSSEPNNYNVNDKQNFSRYYPKRLNAEVLYDSVNMMLGATASFSGLPAGTRAVQLPDTGSNNYFLTVFGRPMANSSCECERSSEANLAQSLHLLNSKELQDKLADKSGRAANLVADEKRSDEEKVRELYRRAYSREPQAEELKIALGYLGKAEQKQHAYEDVIWALTNTKEFLFSH